MGHIRTHRPMMNRAHSKLKSDWKLPGIFAALGEWMNAVARRLNRVVVYGGQGKWTDDGLQLFVSGSISENVYIGGVKYTATGTRDRYLWVYMDDPRAEWKSTTVSPMPPGVEIYDTHENAVHIPRFG